MKDYQRSYRDIIGDVETRLLAMNKLCERISRNKSASAEEFSDKTSDLVAGLWELAEFMEFDISLAFHMTLDKLEKQWRVNCEANGITPGEELPT